MQPKVLKVEPQRAEDGTVLFLHDGKLVGIRIPTGRAVDLRDKPPFIPTSPCIYCDAIDDRGHNTNKHIGEAETGVPFCQCEPSPLREAHKSCPKDKCIGHIGKWIYCQSCFKEKWIPKDKDSI